MPAYAVGYYVPQNQLAIVEGSMAMFPNNRGFAFTIFDDTDRATTENVREVYRFLERLGFRTTKSVWPLESTEDVPIGGESLQNKAYLQFVLSLQSDGFEISLHNVRNHDSPREVVLRGLEEFQALLGQYPRCHSNHHLNRDNIYWGPARVDGRVVRTLYSMATRYRREGLFLGHLEDSRYFWGDLCSSRIQYVRNLTFDEINLDRVNPTMPYHDPRRPFVKYWFSSTDGADVDRFCRVLSEDNQDRLEAEGGVCIMYTHLANGFYESGELHPTFKRLMQRLSRKAGWYVPVSTLLDHLVNPEKESIPDSEWASMKRRWLIEKLTKGTS